MRLAIRHITRYRFEKPIAHAMQRLRLTPKDCDGQKIVDWDMEFENAQCELSYLDQNGNRVHLVSVAEDARAVILACRGTVETSDLVGVVGEHRGPLPLWSFLRHTPLTQPGPEMRRLLRGFVPGDGEERIALLHRLAAAVRDRVDYRKRTTHTRTTAEEAMAAGCGVCQDQAHVFIGAARALDIPARYVSGYLMAEDGMEHGATHAWAEAHVEGLGWVGFDISNGISPDARYVRVATGRDYRDAAPVTGISFGAVSELLEVEVAVAQQQLQQ